MNLILGDARQVLPMFAGKVDFLFADPPYNISNMRNASNNTWNGYTSFKGEWDQIPDYEDFTEAWVQAAIGTLKPGGVICISGVFGSLVPAWQVLLRAGLRFQSHIVWHKTNPAPTVHHRMFANANEIIICFSNGSKWFFDYKRAKELAGRDPHNVFDLGVARRRQGIISKPPRLLQMLVETLCPPDGLILDPFVGTGTTLVAAREAGREAIGIDISPVAMEESRSR